MVKAFAVHIDILRTLPAFLFGRNDAFSVVVGTHLFAKHGPPTSFNVAFDVGGAVVCSAQSQGKNGVGTWGPGTMVSRTAQFFPMLVAQFFAMDR